MNPFGIMLVALSLPTVALAQWQLDYQIQLEHEQQRSQIGLYLGESNDKAKVRQWVNANYQHQGLWLNLRWQQVDTQDDWQLALTELFYDASLGPFELTLGAKHLQWDYQFSQAPLNWWGFAPQQDQPDAAQPLVLAEYFAARSVWQAGCALTEHQDQALCLLRAEYFGNNLDGQLLLGYDQDWRLGLAGQWLATDALNLRTSLAWYAQQSYWQWQGHNEQSMLTANPWQQKQAEAWHWVTGLSYTHSTGLELLLEHSYDHNALSASDWQQINEFNQWLLSQSEHPAQPGNRQALSQASLGQQLSQQQTLLRFSWGQGDWQPSLATQWQWLDSPSWVAVAQTDWHWTPQATVTAKYRLYDPEGPLAQLGQSVALELRVRTR